MKNLKAIQILSLIGSLFIMAQVGYTMYYGEGLCLNSGCGIVEKLTIVPPIFLNIIGLFFFIAILITTRKFDTNPEFCRFALPVLLLSGLAAEGVLTAFQYHIAHSFCSYCLVIFAIILLMNLLGSLSHSAAAVFSLTGIYLIFSLLNFKPSVLFANGQSLTSGTYATRSCTTPQKELFLFFAENCPHCHNVIAALRGCNSCDFHFNPVGPVSGLDLQDLQINDTYSPEVNMAILSLLDIKTVPVLLVKTPEGLDLIKGEGPIIDYIGKACFATQWKQEPIIENIQTQTPYPEIMPDQPLYLGGNEEECSIAVECDTPEPTP